MALTPEDLLCNPPYRHGGSREGKPLEWALGPEALGVLSRRLQPGWRTLETGAGVSTVLFAMEQTHHTCIVPSAEEVERIRAFCAAHAISTERIAFVEQNSEDALPRLDAEPPDAGLLDG